MTRIGVGSWYPGTFNVHILFVDLNNAVHTPFTCISTLATGTLQACSMVRHIVQTGWSHAVPFKRKDASRRTACMRPGT